MKNLGQLMVLIALLYQFVIEMLWLEEGMPFKAAFLLFLQKRLFSFGECMFGILVLLLPSTVVEVFVAKHAF